MKWAKWIMTGLGWAVGGPIGAIFGYFIGSAISGKNNDRIGGGFQDTYSEPGGAYRAPNGSFHRGPYRNTGTPQDLTIALIVLIAAVMKSDGQVKQDELTYVKKFLLKNYGEEKGSDILHVLRDVVKQNYNIQDVCRQIMENTDYDTRYHMVDFLFGLAESDNNFSMAEERMLHVISGYLGISTQDYMGIYSRHVGGSYQGSYDGGNYYNDTAAKSNKDPYKVLGITREATDSEVKSAYRRLALKYHPDKVEGLGDEVKRNAERQFREINEAYEIIKQERGIK